MVLEDTGCGGVLYDIGRVCVRSNEILIKGNADGSTSFLMLPITFLNDDKLRLSKAAVGIFAVAILTAGFSFTGLLTVTVRNPFFQADSLFMPALISCALGLLTIFYNFLINTRYVWNTPAFLLVTAAALSTLVYGALLLYTHRRINKLRDRGNNIQRISQLQRENSSCADHIVDRSTNSERTLYQDPQFYDNYVRNMFPTSAHAPSQPAGGYDPTSITEEEMQRQQMLMLLLQKDHSPSPDPASGGTYRIDWQGRDEDEAVPRHGYYAPQHAPRPSMGSIQRHLSRQSLQPWDGVWRSPAPMQRGRASQLQLQENVRPMSPEERERRRRQIEMGH